MCAFFGWRGERTSTRTPGRPETAPRPVITTWPVRPDELVGVQVALGQATPPAWSPPASPPGSPPRIGGCFVCFARGIAGVGEAGDPAFAAAAVLRDRRVLARAVVRGAAGAPYLPALLALREGRLLEADVRALDEASPRDRATVRTLTAEWVCQQRKQFDRVIARGTVASALTTEQSGRQACPTSCPSSSSRPAVASGPSTSTRGCSAAGSSSWGPRSTTPAPT